MADRTDEYSSWYGTGIYSCRFSTDGREIVAGGRQGYLYVYDLGAMKRTLKIRAHGNDINSCCWADTSSGNVLVSASDDTTLRVWDRRSLGSSPKPSGMLIGHTEGITHVGPKGDGRYVISNGKDQVRLVGPSFLDCFSMICNHLGSQAVGLAKNAFSYRLAGYKPIRSWGF